MGGIMRSFSHALRVTFSLLLVLTFLSTTAFAANSSTLQIKGSDTMVNLGQSWAEAYMGKNPDVSIAVTGGGSGTGIAAILSGTCDLAQSSRDVTEEEKTKASSTGAPLKQLTVAYDGIAGVINKANPVSQLTTDQLADIFSGKIKNWKEVGGKDAAILILSRERNSGTHIFFLEHILRHGNAKGPEEYAASALMMPSSQAIVDEVKTSEAAIGYVGLGYVSDDIKVVEVGKTAAGPFLKPTMDDVLNGSYPIARPLYFLTRGEPDARLKGLIDFVLSADGQEIVKTLDFVPLKK